MKEKFSKLLSVYKKYGIFGFCKKVYDYIVANYFNRISFAVFFNPKKYERQIQEVINTESYDRIILWRGSFGYNVPLFQRPQHIANNLAKNKCLVFYEVTTMTDKVKTLKKLTENFYLINYNNILLNKLLMKQLADVNVPKYVQLYSIDWKFSVEDVEEYKSKGFKLVYEYIDDISPELSGTNEVPKYILDKYNYAMTNKDVAVVTTAKQIYEDVAQKRGTENMVLSCNGVDYNFYQDLSLDYKFEKEFTDIIENGKINVCYYGALASWFDYELAKKISETDKYNLILIGIRYDSSYDESGIDKLKNVHFIGPKEYHILKYYAAKMDVLTIPFVINSITQATSPLKLFEYMALHKPIVTTAMNECKNYASVMVAENHDEFISLLDKAANSKEDADYMALLDKEARENDWFKKAELIIDLLKENERGK